MSERHERAMALFEVACELATAERERFLDSECSDEPKLRSHVEAMLAQDERDTPNPFDDGTGILRRLAEAEGEIVLDRVGPYRIEGLLGRGGMGVVYRAEQENPRRTVALKVLHAGTVSAASHKRFAREAQVLGRLQHPGIAQIYEAGTATDGGQSHAYIAMELIEGKPLNEAAEHARLDTRERLALIARICDAVEHAHRKGVVHRDLKPANVLVTAAGQPKVLDFGIARATDADVMATSLRTVEGQIVGTVPYMSPEQASGDPDAVDGRADVYSLGVLAYELLTGTLPLDVIGKPMLEAVRIIGEDEPTPLSGLDRSLRGDTETIVAKALSKERDRRYASPAELAADIRRFLHDETISARPPSTIYQLKKFARRHRAIVTAGAVVFVGLSIGLGVSIVSMLDARVERDAAIDARDESEAVTSFLVNTLKAANPLTGSEDTTIREVLDASVDLLIETFGKRPLTEARLQLVAGQLYNRIKDFDKSVWHLERARLIYGRELGDAHEISQRAILDLATAFRHRGEFDRAQEHLDAARVALGSDAGWKLTLNLAMWQGLLEYDQGHYQEACAIARGLLADTQRELPEDDWMIFHTLGHLGRALMESGKYVEAEEMLREQIELGLSSFMEIEPHTVLVARFDLANLYKKQGRAELAEPVLRELLDDMRARIGGHVDTMRVQGVLSATLLQLNRLEEALQLAEEVVADSMHRYGPSHQTTLLDKNILAMIHLRMGKTDRAIAIFEELVELHRDTAQDVTPMMLGSLANAYRGAGRLDEAGPLLEECVQRRIEEKGTEAAASLIAMSNLGQYYAECKRFEEADAILLQAIDTARRVLPGNSTVTGRLMQNYGFALLCADRYADAESALLEVFEWYETAGNLELAGAQAAVDNLITLYGQWGKPEMAEPWVALQAEIGKPR
jgi:serine/threonine protein kinase/tetratricopeptide (TPR) repeat protein